MDKVKKRLNKPSSEANDRVSNQVPTVPLMPPEKLRGKGHIVIPYTQGLYESIKKSVEGMGSKLTSKVDAPSRTSWSPLRTKTPWSPKVMPSTGINVGTSHVMMNT